MSTDRPRADASPRAPADRTHRANRSDRLDTASLAASLALHALALAAVLWVLPALQRQPVVYQAVEVRIVSAPAPAPARPEPDDPPPAPREELVVETPNQPPEEPDDAPQETAPPPVPEEVVEAEPEDPAPEPEPEPEDVESESAPPPEDLPAPTEDPAPGESEADEPEDSGEDIVVRMEGLRRNHPAYYANIIRQVGRCFRSNNSDNLEAVVHFVIHADGGVSGIGLSRSSGNFAFDTNVEGAVECAGQPGRLGPLPDGYAWDRLPVEFRFSPRSRGGDPGPHGETQC